MLSSGSGKRCLMLGLGTASSSSFGRREYLREGRSGAMKCCCLKATLTAFKHGRSFHALRNAESIDQSGPGSNQAPKPSQPIIKIESALVQMSRRTADTHRRIHVSSGNEN